MLVPFVSLEAKSTSSEINRTSINGDFGDFGLAPWWDARAAVIDESFLGFSELLFRRRNVAAAATLMLLQRVAPTVAAPFDLSTLDFPTKDIGNILVFFHWWPKPFFSQEWGVPQQ